MTTVRLKSGACRQPRYLLISLDPSDRRLCVPACRRVCSSMLARLITRISRQRKASQYSYVAICRQVFARGRIDQDAIGYFLINAKMLKPCKIRHMGASRFFVRRAMAAEIGAASSSQGARQMKKNRERPNIFLFDAHKSARRRRCSVAR